MLRNDTLDTRAFTLKTYNLGIEMDLTTVAFHCLPKPLPHHPWPQNGVVKLVDQRFGIVGTQESVGHRRRQRQSLDALSRPVGLDLVTGNPPYLLGVGLEECLVEASPEAIGHPLFKGFLLRIRPQLRLEVAQ